MAVLIRYAFAPYSGLRLSQRCDKNAQSEGNPDDLRNPVQR